jgi:hypothetical protein
MRICGILTLAISSVCVVAGGAPAQVAPNGSQRAATPGADTEIATEFSRVKRIYVGKFGTDTPSRQLQAMVISELVKSKRFIVTENEKNADAILEGSGSQQTSHEYHSTSESTSVGGASVGVAAAVARRMGVGDSQSSSETVNHARLAVRLVVSKGESKGDVIWATTKESNGAKYEGASADVAGQVVKQLLWDLDKAQAATK